MIVVFQRSTLQPLFEISSISANIQFFILRIECRLIIIDPEDPEDYNDQDDPDDYNDYHEPDDYDDHDDLDDPDDPDDPDVL